MTGTVLSKNEAMMCKIDVGLDIVEIKSLAGVTDMDQISIFAFKQFMQVYLIMPSIQILLTN